MTDPRVPQGRCQLKRHQVSQPHAEPHDVVVLPLACFSPAMPLWGFVSSPPCSPPRFWLDFKPGQGQISAEGACFRLCVEPSLRVWKALPFLCTNTIMIQFAIKCRGQGSAEGHACSLKHNPTVGSLPDHPSQDAVPITKPGL